MKYLRIAIIAVSLTLIAMTMSMAQIGPPKWVQVVQYERSYEHYQETWKKDALKAARETRKEERKRAREKRKDKRFHAKIARIKGYEVSARKEDSND